MGNRLFLPSLHRGTMLARKPSAFKTIAVTSSLPGQLDTEMEWDESLQRSIQRVYTF